MKSLIVLMVICASVVAGHWKAPRNSGSEWLGGNLSDEILFKVLITRQYD